MSNNDVPEWVREQLRQEGFRCVLEWSQPNELGNTYHLEQIGGHHTAVIEAKCCFAFLQGLQIGKLIGVKK